MSNHAKYTPKHRAAKHRAEGPALLPQLLPRVPKRALLTGLAVVAVGGGGTAVAAAVTTSHPLPTTSTRVAAAAQTTPLEHAARAAAVSRALARPQVVGTPTPTPTPTSTPKPTSTPTPPPVSMPYVSPGSAQAIAQGMFAAHGWNGNEFSCLVNLWNRESHWNPYAANPSGAYGIPQALPGSKMGPGWQNSATVQISWGVGYISRRYGTPCNAWGHSEATGWY